MPVSLPEIAPCVGFDQHNRHHIYDVWGHSAHAVAAVPAEVVLRWTMLLHDIGKPACFTRDEQGVGHFYGHPAISADLAADICRRLRMDNRTAERIVTLVRWHDRDIARTEKAIARAVSQLGEETFRQLLEVKRGDNAAQSPEDRCRLAVDYGAWFGKNFDGFIRLNLATTPENVKQAVDNLIRETRVERAK